MDKKHSLEPKLELVQMGLINDPSTGKTDSVYEIYDMPEVHAQVKDEFPEVAELIASLKQEDLSDEEAAKIRSSITIKSMSLGFNALKGAEGDSQFVVIGSLGAYAIRVSYPRAYETTPREHFHLNAVVEEIAGADYLTFKRRRFKSKK